MKITTNWSFISALKGMKYDYLRYPLPVGDGVTDDTKAIQDRINAGLEWIHGSKGQEFLVTKNLIFKL
jgi:hypothetical protein